MQTLSTIAAIVGFWFIASVAAAVTISIVLTRARNRRERGRTENPASPGGRRGAMGSSYRRRVR
jgi:hypothetical protein